jgi:hypothetical protein
LLERGSDQGLAGNQEDIGTRREVRHEALHGGPQEAFGAVASHSQSDSFSGGHAHTQAGLVAELDYQHNKRVGIRLARTPHPLEIG